MPSFFMDIEIYTIPGCTYCVKAKELMEKAELEYTQHVVGRDISRNDFKDRYPAATSYPYVVIDSEPVGGLVDTAKLFVEKGLVSSKRK